jgi:hypothetical protein
MPSNRSYQGRQQVTDHAETVRNYYREQGVAAERARIREFLIDRISDLTDDDQTADDKVRLDEIEYLFLNDPVLVDVSGETK